ncbi:disintegrin and metalloproteinase domain-containing protein 17 [Plakobranchus ocellatus]|uniref:Disintegrin and metalloproteinase domain-containing protein 17 n=1 Tax=Plakobranchus ocellatus TaxID=259542 RepID=A0AAV4AZ18_9GAST|nr:disintegrin and metalloproteinase domain-containing protein 17 [Plakobranchus ocellatus]
MSVREKRTASGINLGAVTISFHAFQKRFTLFLTPDMRVLHPDIKAELVDFMGTTRPYNIHHNKFYSGTIEGDETQEVDASENDGVWMISIHTPDEYYAVEPLRFYDGRAHFKDMIFYRAGDIKHDNHTNKKPFCEEFAFSNFSQNASEEDFMNPTILNLLNGLQHIGKKKQPEITKLDAYEHNDEIQGFSKEDSASIVRDKRSWRQKGYGERASDCNILAVTDYNLFKGIGAENPASIVQSLVQVYSLADRIFRGTNFGGSFTEGYGIVLKGITIHTNYSDSMNHYNSPNMSMTPFDLLKSMKRLAMFTQYCLVHLTVQRQMGSMLGIAAVAQPNKLWMNGICAGISESDARNVGASTVVDWTGRIMPLKLYSAVLAHEIGHNWGANHDLDVFSDIACRPSTAQGGKFLMWPYTVSYNDPNSLKFSPCSKRDIRKILEIRAHKCFLNKHFKHEMCGNGLLEQSEECDPGFAFLHKDPCCQSNCRLQRGAECSFRNAPCCTNSCTIAPPTHKCYPKGSRVDPS